MNYDNDFDPDNDCMFCGWQLDWCDCDPADDEEEEIMDTDEATRATPGFNLAVDYEGRATLSFVDTDGELHSVTESHPLFRQIKDAVLNDEDPLVFLDSEYGQKQAKVKFLALDSRCEIHDDVLVFDGEPVHSKLANTIVRYTAEDRDANNLVLFLERLSRNPSRRSREQLFTWASDRDLQIDTEGYLLGFKGVHPSPEGDDDFLSVHAGKASVNGVEISGRIPQKVGDVVTMPRPEVQDDVTIGCSHGLHVGSWNYARSFGQVVLEVRIDPADVVSVPTDSAFQKLRVCRYEVIGIHVEETDDLSEYEPPSEYVDSNFAELEGHVPETFLTRLRGWFRR